MIKYILKALMESLTTQSNINIDEEEAWVAKELKRTLPASGYIVFNNLIIPSVSEKIRSTQIDHVIISPYGIFCLETKSHRGNIYGGYKNKYWKQYLGNRSYDLYNPIRQNYHHVKSLEYLLRSRLKSPIHSYVVFPRADRIKISGSEVDLTLGHTIKRILKHQRRIYSPEDIEAMSKGLAFVSNKSSSFTGDHIEEVRNYVATHH